MFLEIRNIKKSFGTGDSKVDVLKGLDLDIEKGESLVVIGGSGTGKSVLIKCIQGLLRPRAQMVEVFLSKAKSWLI